jgi:hypothetical protein
MLSIAIGLGAGFVFDLSYEAAEQLLDPSVYVEEVLGEQQ